MSNRNLISIVIIGLTLNLSLSGLALADDSSVSELLAVFKNQGVTVTDMKMGEILWNQTYKSNGEFPERSCTTCHTSDLTKMGKHIKTGKVIKPMSTVSNPDRLTSIKKINKWFKRNCKWTMDRECTAQEKANMLVYIENKTNF